MHLHVLAEPKVQFALVLVPVHRPRTPGFGEEAHVSSLIHLEEDDRSDDQFDQGSPVVVENPRHRSIFKVFHVAGGDVHDRVDEDLLAKVEEIQFGHVPFCLKHAVHEIEGPIPSGHKPEKLQVPVCSVDKRCSC